MDNASIECGKASYNPMGLYKNFWEARGLYTKIVLLRVYAQKAAPGFLRVSELRAAKVSFFTKS